MCRYDVPHSLLDLNTTNTHKLLEAAVLTTAVAAHTVTAWIPAEIVALEAPVPQGTTAAAPQPATPSEHNAAATATTAVKETSASSTPAAGYVVQISHVQRTSRMARLFDLQPPLLRRRGRLRGMAVRLRRHPYLLLARE